MGDRCIVQYRDRDGVPSPVAYFHWAGARALMQAVRLVELGTNPDTWDSEPSMTEYRPLNGLDNLIPNLYVAVMHGREDSYSHYVYSPLYRNEEGEVVYNDTVQTEWDAGAWMYDSVKRTWTHNGEEEMDSVDVLHWCMEYDPSLAETCSDLLVRIREKRRREVVA